MTAEGPLGLPWLDHLTEGVVLIDGGRVRTINRAAALMLGVDRGQVVGQPVITVFRDHRLERAYQQSETLELETRGRILRARPVPGGIALEDVSALRRAQDDARELLAVLSHELRTPATTVRSTLEALRLDLPEATRDKFLASAEEEAERLIRLLEDLTVEVKPPQLRRIALGEVADRALALLQDTFRDHQIRVETKLATMTVWADTDKLLQVLLNLLENAAVHGPDHATVTLCAVADAGDPRMAVVWVRDEGEPLARETIEQLFAPHARGSSANARGTGLGLYIVRSIALRWGGRAWGRPLDAGNEFGFTVPLRP